MASSYSYNVTATPMRPESVDTVSNQGSHIVVVQPVQTVYVAQPPTRSSAFRGKQAGMGSTTYRPQLILGLVVACCCGCVFGIIAVLFAVLAGRRASDGSDEEANKYGRWSFIASIFGIVIGGIAIVAIIVCISVVPRFGLPSQIYTGNVG